jgi:hypothetical protein
MPAERHTDSAKREQRHLGHLGKLVAQAKSLQSAPGMARRGWRVATSDHEAPGNRDHRLVFLVDYGIPHMAAIATPVSELSVSQVSCGASSVSPAL